MPTPKPWRPLVATGLIALSLACLWGVVLGWVVMIGAQWFSDGGVRRESLEVATDGTPLLLTRSSRDWNDVEYSSLDREPTPLSSVATLSQARFSGPYQPPALVEPPLGWRDRIGGFSNMSRPFAGWYVVRDGRRPGRAYLAAYDPLAKRPFAFASKRGVTPARPRPEEGFEVRDQTVGWGSGMMATSSHLQAGSRAYNQGVATDEGAITPWMAYIIDGDRIHEIDTREKRMRTVTEVGGLRGVALLSEPLPASEGAPQDEEAPNGAFLPAGRVFQAFPISMNQQAMAFVTPAVRPEKRKTRRRLVARGEDAIVLIDPKTDTIDRFPLPEPLRNAGLAVYSLGGGELLVYTNIPWSGDDAGATELFWLNQSGEVTRRRRVQLAGYEQEPPSWAVWGVSAFAPVPAGWLIGWPIGAPLVMIDSRESSGYAEAFATVTEIAWPPLAAVLALGLLLAFAVWRKHRRLYRPDALLWSGLVFLFGPAGWVAYALHWRPPPMDHCGACNRRVPRDREHCPACQADWPAPEPLGTEVFA